MAKRPKKSGHFAFRQHDSIGASDAEDDEQFLEYCFVDTGDLGHLLDCAHPFRLVVGRTGSGKTALLQTLAHHANDTIQVKPESLALAYITNSTILNYLLDMDVKLDVFFRLLWRHVFTVEILKRHFSLKDEIATRNLLSRIAHYFTKADEDRRALAYLEEWGKSFWQETEYRIKEVTTTLEEQLKAEIPGPMLDKIIKAGAGQTLTQQETQEVVRRCQTVINKVQIRALSGIIDLINDVTGSGQRRYYVLIDRLDEDWIEDRFRYHLIRALIETVRDFRRVQCAKIIVAVRYDLLERVFRFTRDAGFQEEKYESLFLHVSWTREQLTEVVDRRLRHLLRDRYTKGHVDSRDILPRQIGGQDSMSYMLARTFFRPRDLIQFFNLSITEAAPKAKLSAQVIRAAEGEYSRKRLRSLADEWFGDYPNLFRFMAFLKGRPASFPVSELGGPPCEDFCLDEVIRGFDKKDQLSALTEAVANGDLAADVFVLSLVKVLYKVGLVGLRQPDSQGVIWTTGQRRSVSQAEISLQTAVIVHPTFWRTLGIRPSLSR